MNVFFHHLQLCAPLFLMVFLGWALIKTGFFEQSVGKALSKIVFKLLMPVMLFHLMSRVGDMPPVDFRVLLAFFGSCIIVFIAGRMIGRRVFGQKADASVITGMGGIFGNNVQLGVPIVQAALGPEAIPTISIIIIFNVLLLWTSATACVEFGRTGGKIDYGKFVKALTNIFKNPIVLGILTGTAWGLIGIELPQVVDKSAALIASATTPMALIAVGMGLAGHSFGASLPKACVISGLKLAVQPALVWFLCTLIGLDQLQTNAATLLACLPVAINLYIMATQFETEEGSASNSIFVSTFVSAITVPFTLTVLGVGY